MQSNEEEGYRYVLPERQGVLGRFLKSRCTIEATPNRLRVSESVGPFIKHVDHAWSQQAIFSVHARARDNQSGDSPHGVLVECDNKTYWVAIGYPAKKLEELVKNLEAAQLEWDGKIHENDENSALWPQTKARPYYSEEPKGSLDELKARISIQETDSGLHIEVPAAGLRKGSHGLILFASVFGGITSIALVGVLVGALQASSMNGIWEALPVLSMFGLASTGMMLASWNMGKRTATMKLDGETLFITRRSIFGVKEWSYRRALISDVRFGPSGVVVNGRPVRELQILVGGNKVLGMLCEWNEQEIKRVIERLLTAMSNPAAEAA